MQVHLRWGAKYRYGLKHGFSRLLLIAGILSAPSAFSIDTFSVVNLSTPQPRPSATATAGAKPAADGGAPHLGLPQTDVLQEVTEEQRKQAEAGMAMNRMNPMSSAFSISNLLGMPGGAGANGVSPAFSRYFELLKNPVAVLALNLLSKEDFSKLVNDLFDHPKKRELVYSQIGLIVFLILFRAWRSSRIKGFLGRLWMSTWTFAVYVVLASYVLPVYWLGDTYTKAVSMVYSAGRDAWVELHKDQPKDK